MTETQAVLIFWIAVPASVYLFLTARLMRMHAQDLKNPDTPIEQNLITQQKGDSK